MLLEILGNLDDSTVSSHIMPQVFVEILPWK